MQALVFDKQLRLERNYPDPRPQAGECAVQVHLAGICATDLHIVRGYMDFRGVLGHEMVGTVAQGSKEWQGRRVACEINCVCTRCDMCQAGLSNHCRKRSVMGILGRDGCFADFVAVPERNLHAVPANVTDEEAVFIEPLAAAYQVQAQCPVDAKTSVAVLGTGRLGLLVAMVLSKTGCRPTAIGRNSAKLLVAERQGIQTVCLDDLAARQEWDVVVECTGSSEGLAVAQRLVRPRGTIVLKSTYAGNADIDLAPLVINEVNVIGSRCGPFRDAIMALERKEIDVRPLISRVFPLSEALAAFDAARDSTSLKILLRLPGNR